jgi:hypothetical protein
MISGGVRIVGDEIDDGGGGWVAGSALSASSVLASAGEVVAESRGAFMAGNGKDAN